MITHMSQTLLVEEFLDAIRERAEAEFNGKMQQAFVAWYIEAEFGKPKWHFTDDTGDGGIDAIVWLDGQTPAAVIIQSKFSERIGGGLLSAGAYAAFDRVVEAFRYGDDMFSDWLEDVRPDLRRIYRKTHERLTASAGHWQMGKRAFRLVTTGRSRRPKENRDLRRSAYVYADDVIRLYGQYRRGETARANHPGPPVGGK